MRFWDSSAIVPLLVAEQVSKFIRSIYEQDSGILVWCLTPVEVIAAVSRKVRDHRLSTAESTEVFGNLDKLRVNWNEVDSILEVRSRAERLVRVHPLRAADSLQLAAALVAANENPTRLDF